MVFAVRPAGRWREIAEPDWRAVFAANVDSAFWLAQAAAPVMKKHGFGRIVHIASGAGLRPSLTGIQAYTAAKHALVGLTKQLSFELGPHGITVNAVAPVWCCPTRPPSGSGGLTVRRARRRLSRPSIGAV